MARSISTKSRRFALAAILGSCAGASQAQVSAYEPSAPAADPQRKAEAEQLVQNVWNAALRTCNGSAIQRVDERLLIELDQPKYQLVAMRLPAAAKQSGYEFRGVALASAARWRWATQTAGASKWSGWMLGETANVRDDNLTLDRGATVVRDVVLKFNIVRKDGVWSANLPTSQVSYAIRPVDPAAPPAPATVACPAQVATR